MELAMNEGNSQKDIVVGCLCALGCEVIFGLSYLFTKQATGAASELALLGWRFIVAFLVMNACVLSGLIKIHLKNKSLKKIVLVAVCNPLIYFTGETVGINYTTASESGVFLASIPIASLVCSTFVLHKKPAPREPAGIGLTLLGVFITVLVVGMEASFSPAGYAMLSMAVISYALYSVFVEKASEFSGIEITYMMLSIGALFFGTLAVGEALIHNSFNTLLWLPLTSIPFLAAVLYQGIFCSILAFFLFNKAIVSIGVNRSSSFIGIATVISIIAGVMILEEEFTIAQMAGVILIIAGVYIANAKTVESRCG